MNLINLGNRIVNNYLYTIEAGYVLIDTGYEKDYAHFKKKLREYSIMPEEIAYVFLTHAHDDHAGFLNQLLGDCKKAKVILSEKGLTALRKGENNFAGGCSGYFALLFCKLMALQGSGEHRFPPINKEYENRFLLIENINKKNIDFNSREEKLSKKNSDKNSIEEKLNKRIIDIKHIDKKFIEEELNGKILRTSGHTSCSVSLLHKDGALFCGDAAMNNFPSIHRIIIWVENKVDYRHSWQKMILLNPKMIYPGHGKPFPVADIKRFLPWVTRIKSLKI